MELDLVKLKRLRNAGFGLLYFDPEQDGRGAWAFCDFGASKAWAQDNLKERIADEVALHWDHVGIPCQTPQAALEDAMEWLDGKRFMERSAAKAHGKKEEQV